MWRSMSGPSLADVKACGQPQEIIDRLNDEHWAGRLYMRRLSPRLTWIFARLGWSPNAVTVGFIGCGLAAGAAVTVSGLAGAAGGAVLIQAYLLLDCSDGELARLTGRTSATGVYLDGIGHYLGEMALLVGLGIRAQGHLALSGGYVSAGLAAAALAALVKAETDNVVVARAKAGLGGRYADETLVPVVAGLAGARRLAAALKLHRVIQAVELSLLILAAAVADAARGGLTATRVLVVACLVIAAGLSVAHLAAIVTSRRLR
jgi:phosphatidylglycerophosphate synthase